MVEERSEKGDGEGGLARMNCYALDSNAVEALHNGDHTAENNILAGMSFFIISQCL